MADTGAGGTKSDTDMVSITVTAVNDAPINTVPGAQTTLEDNALVFSGSKQISVNDSDIAETSGGKFTVSLTVLHGTLQLSSLTGLTITGGADNTATVTFRGLPGDVNAALNGLIYTPVSNNITTDTLTINTGDEGNTGAGGVKSDTDMVSIAITPVNDLPVITEGASISRTISEDGIPTSFSLTLNATDVDGDTLTWSISSGASHGTAGASGEGTSKAISYTPDTNSNGTDSFVVQVSDGHGGVDTILVNVNIDAYNDAPVNVVPGGQTTAEDTAIVFSGTKLISVSDPDVAETGGGQLQVTLSALHGVLKLSTTSSLTVTGDNTASVMLTGLPVNVNAALNGLSYTPGANYNGSETLTIATSDLGRTGAGGTKIDTDMVSITVTAVNDAPVITEGASTSVTMSEDGVPTAFSLTLNATDVENNPLTWSISAGASHGSAAASGSGVSKAISYSPTCELIRLG